MITPVTIHPAVTPRRLVRALPCGACPAPARSACTPDGDHLARWVAACQAGLISRGLLAGVLAGLIVPNPGSGSASAAGGAA